MRKLLLYALLLTTVFIVTTAPAQDTAPADVSGEWAITLTFVSGTGSHTAVIHQDGVRLKGQYRGEMLEGSLSGTVEGSNVIFTGRLRKESTGVSFRYTGTVKGDTMSGTVDMGEYWTADFTAERKSNN